jgi:hypothetical protein
LKQDFVVAEPDYKMDNMELTKATQEMMAEIKAGQAKAKEMMADLIAK